MSKTFEEALKRLEEITELLEQGTAGLDESLKLFEESVELKNFCEKKLEQAENKLYLLTKENDAYELQSEDF